MALSSRTLNYEDRSNKTTIKLYTSLDDIYTGKGLPIEYKGETVYAPLVENDDVFSTPLTVEDTDGEWKIAYETIGEEQNYYSNKVTNINLSGNTEKEVVHHTFAFVAPYTGKYRLKSEVRGGQTGSGYSGDKWQWSKWWIDIDTVNIVEKMYRRSQGMGWKTLYDGEVELTGGLHILKLRIRGKCSSKDSHRTSCYKWKNVITIKE